MCPMALQYGLKDSPCSTEWIDVCYRCTCDQQIYLNSIWSHFSDYTAKCEAGMKFIQNYHNERTKIEFGMLIVVILYEFHTSYFAVYACHQNSSKKPTQTQVLMLVYLSKWLYKTKGFYL